MGGEAKGKIYIWSIKYDNVHIQLRIIIKLPVNLNITIYTWGGGGGGIRCPTKASSLILKSKPKAHGFYEALHAGL